MAQALATLLRAVEFDSRSGGEGHRVEIHQSRRAGLAGPAGTVYVTCSCVAGRNYWARLNRGDRVTGCWAMQRVRAQSDIPTPAFRRVYSYR